MSGVEKNRPGTPDDRERLLEVLSAATFVTFFQAFMVVPIIPGLAAAAATLASLQLFRSELSSRATAAPERQGP